MSAQHLRQKEKKKKAGAGEREKPQPGKLDSLLNGETPRQSVNVKKQPIMAVCDLLDAILADCNSDPTTLQPLKNSFKKLLQIQRHFKVPVDFSVTTAYSSKISYYSGRGGCAGSVLEAICIQVSPCTI